LNSVQRTGVAIGACGRGVGVVDERLALTAAVQVL